jgi:hypothetical protein
MTGFMVYRLVFLCAEIAGHATGPCAYAHAKYDGDVTKPSSGMPYADAFAIPTLEI